MVRIFLCILFISNYCFAGMDENYSDSVGFAKDQLKNNNLVGIDQLIPGTQIQTNSGLNDSNIQSQAIITNNEAADFVRDSNSSRGRFNNIENEVFQKDIQELLSDPVKALSEGSSNCHEFDQNLSSNGGSILVNCKESSELQERVCTHDLIVNVNVIPAREEVYGWYCTNHNHGHNDPKCGSRAPLSRVIPAQFSESSNWRNNCSILENLVDQNICNYSHFECSQGPETRYINGQPIYKSCWQKKYYYQCGNTPNNSCQALKDKGCVQVKSVCSKYQSGKCVEWNQSFECPAQNSSSNQKRKLCGEQPFCIDGDCTPQDYQNNDEMLEAISYLNIFGEMSKDISNPSIFAGEKLGCKKRPLDFIDCCKTGKGWGKNVGLGRCNANEKSLSKRREKRHCKLVGTYCKEKALGVCVLKQTNFCCFGSPLLRMIQEQARAQIGLGWGTPKKPICRGLTIEELQRVDFSKLDLSEFFAEVAARFKSQDMNEIKEKVSKRLQSLGEEIKNK